MFLLSPKRGSMVEKSIATKIAQAIARKKNKK
jgi:hypothetical protein